MSQEKPQGKEPQVMPNEPQVMPDEPQVMPNEPQVMPNEPQVMPNEPQVMPDEPQVMLDEPQVMPNEPQVMPDEPLPNVPQCVVGKVNNVIIEKSSIKQWFSKQLQLTPITSPTTVLQIPTLAYTGSDSFTAVKHRSLLTKMRNVNSAVQHLTFYTQNVWFDKFNQAERFAEIVSVIETGQPDFVCLQEVIHPLLKLLKDSRIIQEQYYISGNLINGYGLTILSKWPCVFTEVRYDKMTFQSRSLLCCQTMVNGAELVVTTTHLESCRANTEYRVQQLAVVMSTLKPHSQALVMGDFNYVPEWKEEGCLDKDFKDLFKYAGSLRINYSHIRRSERLDRMLLKSDTLSPTADYYPVGLTPCKSYTGQNVLRKDGVIRSLSDHLGIIAVVNVV